MLLTALLKKGPGENSHSLFPLLEQKKIDLSCNKNQDNFDVWAESLVPTSRSLELKCVLYSLHLSWEVKRALDLGMARVLVLVHVIVSRRSLETHVPPEPVFTHKCR